MNMWNTSLCIKYFRFYLDFSFMNLYTSLIQKLYKKRKFFDLLLFIVLLLGVFNMLFYRYVTLKKKYNFLIIFILLCYLAIGLQALNQFLGLQFPDIRFIYYSFMYLTLYYYILSKLLLYTNLLKVVAVDYKTNLHELFGNPFGTFSGLVAKVLPKTNKIAVGVGIAGYSTAKIGYFYDGEIMVPHIRNIGCVTPEVRELIVNARHSLLDSHVNWLNPSFHINPSKVTLQEFFMILEQVDEECIDKDGIGKTSYSKYLSIVDHKVKHSHVNTFI